MVEKWMPIESAPKDGTKFLATAIRSLSQEQAP